VFTAPQLTLTPPVVTQQPVATDSAWALARAYCEYISAYWRGDAGAAQLGNQLVAFFSAEMPAEPMRPADAFSPHGARGHGIRWYERGDAVLGYVPGATSGYRIPRACVVPFCSAASRVGPGGSLPLDNPGEREAGQSEKSETAMPASVAHAVVPFAPTALAVVA
jgi:hypothetical protein